jgi:hypothetical protein
MLTNFFGNNSPNSVVDPGQERHPDTGELLASVLGEVQGQGFHVGTVDERGLVD